MPKPNENDKNDKRSPTSTPTTPKTPDYAGVLAPFMKDSNKELAISQSFQQDLDESDESDECVASYGFVDLGDVRGNGGAEDLFLLEQDEQDTSAEVSFLKRFNGITIAGGGFASQCGSENAAESGYLSSSSGDEAAGYLVSKLAANLTDGRTAPAAGSSCVSGDGSIDCSASGCDGEVDSGFESVVPNEEADESVVHHSNALVDSSVAQATHLAIKLALSPRAGASFSSSRQASLALKTTSDDEAAEPSVPYAQPGLRLRRTLRSAPTTPSAPAARAKVAANSPGRVSFSSSLAESAKGCFARSLSAVPRTHKPLNEYEKHSLGVTIKGGGFRKEMRALHKVVFELVKEQPAEKIDELNKKHMLDIKLVQEAIKKLSEGPDPFDPHTYPTSDAVLDSYLSSQQIVFSQEGFLTTLYEFIANTSEDILRESIMRLNLVSQKVSQVKLKDTDTLQELREKLSMQVSCSVNRVMESLTRARLQGTEKEKHKIHATVSQRKQDVKSLENLSKALKNINESRVLLELLVAEVECDPDLQKIEAIVAFRRGAVSEEEFIQQRKRVLESLSHAGATCYYSWIAYNKLKCFSGSEDPSLKRFQENFLAYFGTKLKKPDENTEILGRFSRASEALFTVEDSVTRKPSERAAISLERLGQMQSHCRGLFTEQEKEKALSLESLLIVGCAEQQLRALVEERPSSNGELDSNLLNSVLGVMASVQCDIEFELRKSSPDLEKLKRSIVVSSTLFTSNGAVVRKVLENDAKNPEEVVAFCMKLLDVEDDCYRDTRLALSVMPIFEARRQKILLENSKAEDLGLDGLATGLVQKLNVGLALCLETESENAARSRVMTLEQLSRLGQLNQIARLLTSEKPRMRELFSSDPTILQKMLVSSHGEGGVFEEPTSTSLSLVHQMCSSSIKQLIVLCLDEELTKLRNLRSLGSLFPEASHPHLVCRLEKYKKSLEERIEYQLSKPKKDFESIEKLTQESKAAVTGKKCVARRLSASEIEEASASVARADQSQEFSEFSREAMSWLVIHEAEEKLRILDAFTFPANPDYSLPEDLAKLIGQLRENLVACIKAELKESEKGSENRHRLSEYAKTADVLFGRNGAFHNLANGDTKSAKEKIASCMQFSVNRKPGVITGFVLLCSLILERIFSDKKTQTNLRNFNRTAQKVSRVTAAFFNQPTEGRSCRAGSVDLTQASSLIPAPALVY